MAEIAAAIVVPEVSKEDADADENYLYGQTSENKEPAPQVDASGSELNAAAEEFVSNGVEEVKEDQKDGDDEDGEFDESDDDDDNIQVHIGEVNANATAAGVYGTPVSWKKDGVAAGGAAKSAILPTQGQKKIDVNAVGLINGQPIYEYDIDNDHDDKPWRKPGADISDYFNYGFNEEIWKQYCEKQRRMRLETNRGSYSVTAAPSIPSNAQVEIEVLPDGRTRVKAGPPPDRKVEGSIHVIGSDDARRKQKEDELLALALGSTRVMAPTAFPGQRPLYTALPTGAMMYNANSNETSQPQQIQSIGGTSSGIPPGLQYISSSGQAGLNVGGPPQIFPPAVNVDPFLHPGNVAPPGGYNYNSQNRYNSGSDYDSDGENRRHRSSRREPSRHRRHRDRSDRDRSDRDRDRDRSKSRSERDRSSSRVRREHSKSSSDRKKHSSRSLKEEDEPSERRSRSSRRSKQTTEESDETKETEKERTPEEMPAIEEQKPVAQEAEVD